MIHANSKNCVINNLNTIGFMAIDDFKGQTTTIRINNLKNFVDVLKILNKMGFDEVKLGIEKDSPLLMFLDKQNKTALAIAPILHNEEG